VKLQKKFADSPKSWTITTKDVDQEAFDLSVKNPNGGAKRKERTAKEVLGEIEALDLEATRILAKIKQFV
jgi:type I restriction enzyme M protein